jgi:hypothetical protein
MDLEDFDAIDNDFNQALNTESSFSTTTALDHLDQEWYANASRRARWMDLLGDYAGNEAFVIDGLFSLLTSSWAAVEFPRT